MKPIRGLQAPTPGLASYRKDHPESQNWDEFHDDYRSGQAYKELISALVDMQRGLCAYCEIDRDGSASRALSSQVRHGIGCELDLRAEQSIRCVQGWYESEQPRYRASTPTPVQEES